MTNSFTLSLALVFTLCHLFYGGTNVQCVNGLMPIAQVTHANFFGYYITIMYSQVHEGTTSMRNYKVEGFYYNFMGFGDVA